ncbi:hypothetical protein OROGR_001928 [Orobanche gracilis]
MVKSVENGISLPPFLVKCYEMVNDESTKELISWSESNDSFIIWDESRFTSQMLPKYFKHSNFSSFVRQLNIYGFRKIDTDHWQFANESFIKGQKHLLKNIIRRKHPQNQAQTKPSKLKETDPTPKSKDDKKAALWKEVENLKTDKIALAQELLKLSQHQQTSQSKMLLLREQMKGMEKNQQQMLSFIVMAMQSPEFMLQFFQPKENSWRVSENGNTKLSEVITGACDLTPSDGAIVRYRQPEASKYDDLMGLDFSSDEIRDLFMDIDVLLGPADEKSISAENHDGLVLPEVNEHDNMLEQLLLSYPSTRNDLSGLEGEDCDNSGLHIQPAMESDESDESGDDVRECQNDDVMEDKSERVESLTQQVGVLTSEIEMTEPDIVSSR